MMRPADCYIEFQANCPGRFVAGAECDPDPFDPPCGEWTCTGILYAPSNPDNAAFRADVTAITGQPCDFWDASASTPTLDDIKDYCCVLTWGNYAYADAVGFGDVLAAFVDQGGKVMLGQWTYHSTQNNWLEGEIMTEAYCPVTVASYSSGAYVGDGIDCVHVLGPVTAYNSDYLDIATAISGAVTDGTFDTGSLAVAWRPDRRVYYSPGNTGATLGTGDWAQLVANMCSCTDEPLIGACCNPFDGTCAMTSRRLTAYRRCSSTTNRLAPILIRPAETRALAATFTPVSARRSSS